MTNANPDRPDIKASEVRTHRVSIVPGMVLQVHVIPSPLEPDEMLWKLETTPQPFVGVAQVSGTTVLVDHDRATPITVPPVTAGMWVVKVKVAS